MHYHINSVEQIEEEFEKIKLRTELLFRNLSNEQYNFKPTPKKWSAGECIEHLNLTGGGYLKNIQTTNQSITGNKMPFKLIYQPRFLLKKFAMITGPDSKIKMPSPKFLQASSSMLDKNVVDNFISLQNKFLNIITRIELEHLKRIKVTWPAFPLMKLQLGEVLVMTVGHEQRHLNQAERTLLTFTNLGK
jgi:hypothetical protein